MKKINIIGKHIYFIGIGGVSMSGLAFILHDMGYHISGSDRTPNRETKKLEALGINIHYGQKSENITDDIDLVIYTAAIAADNPELVAVHDKNITNWTRAKLLGELIMHYPYSVCIAGTHGKTTTTSMVTHLLRHLDPTITVGAYLEAIKGNFHLGDSDYFVVESCEYNDSFFEFNPFIGVILNVEYDHPDHFKSLEHVENSFNTFAKNTRGSLVVNKDILHYDRIVNGVNANIVTFAQDDDTADYPYTILDNHTFLLAGKKICLPVAGVHNIQNAIAALICADLLGVDVPSFDGYINPKRRLESKGTTANGAIIIDDYAHHPTEIQTTLHAIRESYPHKTVYCLFQPHTFSRTQGLLNEFSDAFSECNTVLLLDIYAAREIDHGEIHTKDLLNLIKPKQDALYFENNTEALKFLQKSLNSDSVLITMGATDVYLLGEQLVSA